MAKVYLSVGSNIGDRQKFIRLALKSIADFCKVLRVSSTYETEPWGKTDQPAFLNLCLEIETSLKPKRLLEKLKSIEEDLGRTKADKWAEREIDIDILFYDNLVLNDPELVIPHPRIEERAFVLVPLEEIAPDYKHPGSQRTIRGLAKCIDSKGVRRQIKIMGVINMTPDSFSDGGELENRSLLKKKVQEMIYAGVDIIDVGGESTRPGHKEVEAEEEIRRVLPAIRAIREISIDISISVDTQKAEVAEKALQAGANIINDVSALSDTKMPQVIKKYDCQVILMRNRPLDEKNLIESCKNQFEEIVEKCLSLGISKEKIILDPGLGFGDLASGDFTSLPGGSPSANTQLVLSINDYSLGLPVLIGASRKRFLGEMSGQKNSKKRLAESLAFACLAESCGASMIRVHDFKETMRFQP